MYLSRRTFTRLGSFSLLLAFSLGGLTGVGRVLGEEPSRKTTVELTIDYGDGVQKRFPAILFRAGMTVLDALQDAQKHPRGIRFEHRGSGETAFVSKIDDLANEGRGRNWTYGVNDKKADRSCGVFSLTAGDRVVWKFGTGTENP